MCVCVARSLNGTFFVTPVHLHRGASSFVLGRPERHSRAESV